jgi:hypothetical protein
VHGPGKVARIRGSVVHQLRDFFDIIYFDNAVVFQSQSNRARDKRNRSKVLTKPIVQFLSETLLFAIADFKNFAFKSFAPSELGFQLFVCHTQLVCSLANAVFQQFFRFLQCGFRTLAPVHGCFEPAGRAADANNWATQILLG